MEPTDDADELGSMYGNDMDSSIPLSRDHRWWIRLPAKISGAITLLIRAGVLALTSLIRAGVLALISLIRASVRTLASLIRESVRESPKLYLHLLGDYLNALLVFLPLGVIGRAVGWDANAVFALNSLALFPLPGLLSFTRERSYNKIVEGLLNMISVNLIPLIVSLLTLESRIHVAAKLTSARSVSCL